MIVRIISLWQPLAWAMMEELKRHETRSKCVNLRGCWLGIHAAQRPFDFDRMATFPFPDKPAKNGRLLGQLATDGFREKTKDRPLVFGALYGFVWMEYPVKTEWIRSGMGPRELAYGDYDDGRWVWKTSTRVALPVPVPMKGRQFLWKWETGPEIESLLLLKQEHRKTLFEHGLP